MSTLFAVVANIPIEDHWQEQKALGGHQVRGSLKSLAPDRVVRCFIGQFTNSYEEMGMTPRTPKVGEREFQKKACVSGTSLRAKWVQFLQTLRLSSRRTCCSAPEGRILSECACVCTYTHRHIQSKLTLSQWIYLHHSSSFTAQRALWKRGHKDGKKILTARKSVVKQSLLQKWNRNNGNINGHTDVEGGQFHRVPPLNKEPEKWLLGEGGFAYVEEHRVGGGFNQVILYAFMRFLYIYIY